MEKAELVDWIEEAGSAQQLEWAQPLELILEVLIEQVEEQVEEVE